MKSRILRSGQGNGLILARQPSKKADPTMHQTCIAFQCGKPSRDEFCPFHWAHIPSELKREWEQARDESVRLKRLTARRIAMFQRVFKFLAEQDVSLAKQKVAAEKAAREVESE